MGLEAEKWALDQELCFKAGNCDLGLKARIWESKQEFGPPGCDLGLEVRIWALRCGRGGYKEAEGKIWQIQQALKDSMTFALIWDSRSGGDGGGGEEGEIWYGQQAPKDPMTYA